MSAWRIEIRTGFYHRAKKTRPIKGLKLNPAEWRWWVLLAQCKTLGETQSKTGTTRRLCPLYLLAACLGAPLHGGELLFHNPIRLRCAIFSSYSYQIHPRR